MKDQANNLQVARWTDDPAQREKFFTEVGPRIDGESRRMARRYGVGMYQEDIKSEIQAELLQQMLKIDTDGPFAKDSPNEASDFYLEKENYQVREKWARPLARKIAKQSRQAEILADVRQPDLPPEIETQLFAVAKSLSRIVPEIANFTSRDSDIFRMEVLRQVGVDDLPAPIFDQVAQAAGISSSKLRAYLADYEQQGHVSTRNRKAWSRARAKVLKAFTRAKLTTLLVIVFALSLALLNAIHQSRSIHQDDFVNQGSLIDEIAVAHQGNKIHQNALAYQGNKIHQNALAHQSNKIHENTLAYQGNKIHQNALAYQGNLIYQNALAHQTT